MVELISKNYLQGVVLDYFTTALGDALTPEAGEGWSNFMDLCIEVVTETAKGTAIINMKLN